VVITTTVEDKKVTFQEEVKREDTTTEVDNKKAGTSSEVVKERDTSLVEAKRVDITTTVITKRADTTAEARKVKMVPREATIAEEVGVEVATGTITEAAKVKGTINIIIKVVTNSKLTSEGRDQPSNSHLFHSNRQKLQ